MVMGELSQKTEVLVIGAGPGGYVAAIRAAQLGKKVILIDGKSEWGGVCLHHGCIPSKALIHATEVFHELESAKDFGLIVENPKLDFKKMQEWKKGIIEKLTNGIKFLCQQNKIEIINAFGRFQDSNRVRIYNENKRLEYSAIEFEECIIATGSKSRELKGLEYDGKLIIDSEGALDIDTKLDKLVIIGGGYIAVELASMFAKSGIQVELIHRSEHVMTYYDSDVALVVQKKLEKLGVKLYLNSIVTKTEKKENSVKLTVESKSGEKTELEADKVVVAVGRIVDTSNLDLQNTKVKTNEKGIIEIDETCKTSDSTIYAIGDVTGEPMLAHRASTQGKIAAEVIAGQKSAFDNRVIPGVVYCDPEIASVGLSERQAKEQGIEYKVGKFPFSALGRALTINAIDGFVKFIVEKSSNEILGIWIVGKNAGDLISECALAMESYNSLEDIALTIHPHPTMSEAIMEAAEATLGHAIHIPPKKRITQN